MGVSVLRLFLRFVFKTEMLEMTLSTLTLQCGKHNRECTNLDKTGNSGEPSLCSDLRAVLQKFSRPTFADDGSCSTLLKELHFVSRARRSFEPTMSGRREARGARACVVFPVCYEDQAFPEVW